MASRSRSDIGEMVWLGIFAVMFLLMATVFLFGWIPFTGHSGWMHLIVSGSTMLVLWGYLAEITIAFVILFAISTLSSLIVPMVLIALFVLFALVVEAVDSLFGFWRKK